jgi:hypothetical protein
VPVAAVVAGLEAAVDTAVVAEVELVGVAGVEVQLTRRHMHNKRLARIVVILFMILLLHSIRFTEL